MGGGGEKSGAGPSVLILALLAALGVGPSILKNSRVTAADKSTASQVVVPKSAEDFGSHSAASLLENFFAMVPADVAPGKPWLDDGQPWVSDSLPDGDVRKRFTISFLIATVPAPISPFSRHDFDSYVNSIEMAAGREDYVLDSFDLPWAYGDEKKKADFHLTQEIAVDLRETPGASPTVGEGGQSRGRESPIPDHVLTLRPNATERERAGADPGIMLFRRDDDTGKRLLVVFLVGESPVRGIDKASLRDSLEQIAWLSGWSAGRARPPRFLLDAVCGSHRREIAGLSGGDCPDRPREIRIVGPTFSGSAPSMRNTLAAWLDEQEGVPPKITILSGTATAIGNSLGWQNGPVDVEFHSVRVADSAIWSFIPRFFHVEPNRSRPAIAILSDDTSYGAWWSRNQDILRVPFPVHIADVRRAAALIDQPATADNSATGRHDIPIADDGNRQPDIIPLFSSRSAAYDELVLENLLSALKTENVRYIGVVATDVEDLVFLVHEIRKTCPDTVVFTTSADLRYIHSDANRDLLGMLVFSTYPLFSRNQDWTYPFEGERERVEFPGEDAEGVFNATVAQLGATDKMEEYGPPFAAVDRSQTPTPAIWVGVVGRDNIWPLQYMDKYKAENLYLPDHSGDGVPHVEFETLYPLPFQIGFLVLCLGCLIPSLGMVWPALVTSATTPGSARSWVDAFLGDAVFLDLRRERWMRISAFLTGLLVAFVVGAGYFLLPLKCINPFSDLARLKSAGIAAGFGTFFGLVTIPPIVWALVIALRRVAASMRAADRRNVIDERSPTGAGFALFGSAVGVVLVSAFVLSQWRQTPPACLLSFVRAVNLDNGVSPLMPLIFLGIANLCLIGGDLWRLRLLEDCRITPPFLNFEADAKSFSGADTLEARIVHLLECSPWELPGTWPALAFSIMSCGYFVWRRGLPMAPIDGLMFNWLFFLSAAFIYFYFSIQLLRFVWVWNAVHRLLRRLYWHPSRSAYSALRARSLPEASGQTIRLIEPRPSLTAMEFCLQCAREILACVSAPEAKGKEGPGIAPPPDLVAEIEDAIGSAERHLATALAAQSDSDWRCELIHRMMAQAVMARLSSRITALMEPAWRLTSIDSSSQPAAADGVEAQAGMFVASRVVDFLRQVFPQLRLLSGSAMAGLLALLLAASAYPFVQRDTLLWLSWIVMLGAIATGVIVFVQINRSRIISMLYGTTPGRFNWDSAFTMRMLTFGVIPILTLLGAQYPNALGGMISWIGRNLAGVSGQ